MKFQILLLSLLLFCISCSSEVPIDCGENGVYCEECEECWCDLYYEGEVCEIEIRERFIGTWIGTGHNCENGEKIADGFKVEILKQDDVTKVKMKSPDLFTKDSIIVDMDFIGYLRHEESKRVGNKIMRLFKINVYYDDETNELSVFIDRNEDCDEWNEFCFCTLKRE